jgi:flagellar hook-basal body complex protein FliE
MINFLNSTIPLVGSQLQMPGSAGSASPTAGSNFADVFQSAVSDVDSLQNNADQQVAAVMQGAGNADLGNTMISVEKADIAFQLMMQVRNKAVSAYQEMEKMQF